MKKKDKPEGRETVRVVRDCEGWSCGSNYLPQGCHSFLWPHKPYTISSSCAITVLQRDGDHFSEVNAQGVSRLNTKLSHGTNLTSMKPSRWLAIKTKGLLERCGWLVPSASWPYELAAMEILPSCIV